jgi:hypothetical protein
LVIEADIDCAAGRHPLALACSRYNDLVEHRRARHIGEIISERYDSELGNPAARAGEIRRPPLELRKILWLLLDGALDALATIGWFVTLPFITRHGAPLKTREQSRPVIGILQSSWLWTTNVCGTQNEPLRGGADLWRTEEWSSDRTKGWDSEDCACHRNHRHRCRRCLQ